MKKFFLPLLTLALTVVTMASCSSNDDSGSGSTPSSKTTYYCAKYFISNEMAELGTFTLTVSDGTKTSTYDLVKNGKQNTYTFGDYGTQTGYEFTYTQPSEKAITLTVNYTASEKAKALTSADKVNWLYGTAFKKTTSPTTTLSYDVLGGVGTKGNYVVSCMTDHAKIMGKQEW